MKRFLLPLTGFFVVLVVHASYTIFENVRLAEHWARVADPNYIALYFSNGEYLVGASYALAVGFSIYALVRFAGSRNKSVTGFLGGITFTGALYVGGCFLLGCCGSPMLAVYLTLFGSSFLGFTKPLTCILILASVVVVGYIWMERSSKSVDRCCMGDEQCKTN